MKKQGFTLVELLVAISIVAILTAVVLPNFLGAREKAQDTKKKSELQSMKNALRLYYNDKQYYPINKDTFEASLSTYSPQIVPSQIGYTYYYTQTNSGEGFQLCVDLDAALASEITDSQNRCRVPPLTGLICGVNPASYTKRYVVCGN